MPVAAGLGGGSADAAAVLRLARGEVEGIRSIAAAIGADVPSQVAPRPCLVAGAGEIVEPVPPPGEHAVILVPQEQGLSTAEVYAEADKLGSEPQRGRARRHPPQAPRRDPSREPRRLPTPSCWSTTSSRRPSRFGRRSAAPSRRSPRPGAAHAMVTGSGPTAVGLFADRGRR